MKHIRLLIVSLVAFALVVTGPSAWAAAWTDFLLGKDLDSLLGKQLGLTGDQSKGGLGAIMGLAKEKLTAVDFDKIAKVVPGADKYVEKAKKLGLLDKPMGSADGLGAAFSKLGIPKDTAAKMVPTVTDLVGKVGGDEVKSLLAGALK